MKIKKLLSTSYFPLPASKGQAYVELVLVIPLFIIFLVGITYFSKYFMVQIRLNQALRYAPWLRTYGYGYQVSNEDVKQEIKHFLSESSPTVISDDSIFSSDVKGGRKGGALEGPFRATKIEVDLEYNMPLPRLLSAMPGFSKPWKVRARTELYP